MEYYIVQIKLDRINYFLLWGEDEDGIDKFLMDHGKVLHFHNLDNLLLHVKKETIELAVDDGEAPNVTDVFDLDKINFWVKHPRKHIDTNMFNQAWNYAGDLNATIPFDFRKHYKNKVTLKIYDKLFWGLNLPVVTPAGRYYVPLWKHKEVMLLRNVMRDVIEGFRKALV
ncbi:hypothetical protein BH09BAC1_BH09BAC1_27990 [soil metagenome]